MGRTLYIIRGLPGSGKSTLGEQLANGHSYAADDWFTDEDGDYNFVPSELPDAHEDCRARVLGAMLSGVEKIAVCNTFTQKWEAEPYFKLCNLQKYTPVIIECQSQFGNIHGCPPSKVEEMRERWESIT